MDRNSIIGLLLIGFIIIGYTIYNQPSKAELEAMRHKQDSIATVQRDSVNRAIAMQKTMQQNAQPLTDSTLNDSTKQALAEQQLGVFATAATGAEQNYILENNLIRMTLSSKGGKVKSVELKKYKTYDGRPVMLMSHDSSNFNLAFPTQNRTINTADLYFQSPGISTNNSVKSISMRVNVGANKYLEYLYSISEDSYLVTFKINAVGLNDVIAQNATYLAFDWKENALQQEKSLQNEVAATSVYYSFPGEDVDNLSYGKDDQKSLKTKVKWIAFKQQFFTSVLIAGETFESPFVSMQAAHDKNVVKNLAASFSMPYNHAATESYNMEYYFGPNHYQTLKKINDPSAPDQSLHLEKQIRLGWGIFGLVNKFLVIPTFNYLNSFHLNFGLIILMLTIMVRIILLPLTFGSYKSQAKIKVLQPEIKEINEKFPKQEDAMKKQQEMMALYKRAGVNPLGGCIPGLLQLPILIAMFNFFPTSIELRQQSFLWAKDLSTYDSILDLPFKIPFYGDHVSLFTLLMTVSTILFTRINTQMTSAANPQMKWMMYLMPIMFLGIFNNYSSGLSYYYFLSNIFGLAQQQGFKFLIDEDAIHRQIQENKKKPVKKSSFQSRLEQMAKQRGYPVKK